FALAPWAGAAADRFDRRRLLVVTQLGAVAVTALLAVLTSAGLATTPLVIGLALILGLSTAFAIPALQALVPALVTPSDLPPAVTLAGRRYEIDRRLPVMCAVLAGAMAAFALSSTLPVAAIALVIGGFGFLATNTAATTALQLGIEEEQRGRVMALWSVAFLGT